MTVESAHWVASVYASAYTHGFFSALEGNSRGAHAVSRAHGFAHHYAQAHVVARVDRDPIEDAVDGFVQAVSQRSLSQAREILDWVKDKTRFFRSLKTRKIVIESRCSRAWQGFIVGSLMDALAKEGYERLALMLLKTKPKQTVSFYGRYLRAAVAWQRTLVVQYICDTCPEAALDRNPVDGGNALHNVMTEGSYFVSANVDEESAKILHEKGRRMIGIARIVSRACPLSVIQPDRRRLTPLQELELYRAKDRSAKDEGRAKMELLCLGLSRANADDSPSILRRLIRSPLFDSVILEKIFPFLSERRANAELILQVCNIFKEALQGHGAS